MAPPSIGSSHPIVRDVSAARRGIGARSRGRIAIDGLWAHEHALARRADVEVFLRCPDLTGTGRARTCADRMQEHARESYLISPRTLARLGATESGLISTIRLPAWTPDTLELSSAALVLVADGIEYAGNSAASSGPPTPAPPTAWSSPAPGPAATTRRCSRPAAARC